MPYINKQSFNIPSTNKHKKWKKCNPTIKAILYEARDYLMQINFYKFIR